MYHRAFLVYLTALVFLVSAVPPVPGKSAQLEQLKGRIFVVFEGSGTCAATVCSSQTPCTGKCGACVGGVCTLAEGRY